MLLLLIVPMQGSLADVNGIAVSGGNSLADAGVITGIAVSGGDSVVGQKTNNGGTAELPYVSPDNTLPFL